jgi:PAS domain S-box-containing protein
MLAVDEQWRIAYVNDAAAQLAFSTPDELAGRELWSVFPEVRGTEFESAGRRAKDERSVVRVEALYPSADRWMEACAHPIEWGFALRVRDVSARKRAEQHAREASESALLLQNQAEESRALSERLAAVNDALRAANDELVALSVTADTAREVAERAVKQRYEVISMVAHDLKNPLHTISITLAVLQDVDLTEADRRRKLGIIENTVHGMDRHRFAGSISLAAVLNRLAQSPRPIPGIQTGSCGEDRHHGRCHPQPAPCLPRLFQHRTQNHQHPSHDGAPAQHSHRSPRASLPEPHSGERSEQTGHCMGEEQARRVRMFTPCSLDKLDQFGGSEEGEKPAQEPQTGRMLHASLSGWIAIPRILAAKRTTVAVHSRLCTNGEGSGLLLATLPAARVPGSGAPRRDRSMNARKRKIHGDGSETNRTGTDDAARRTTQPKSGMDAESESNVFP